MKRQLIGTSRASAGIEFFRDGGDGLVQVLNQILKRGQHTGVGVVPDGEFFRYSTRSASTPLAELISNTGLPSISTVARPLTCSP